VLHHSDTERSAHSALTGWVEAGDENDQHRRVAFRLDEARGRGLTRAQLLGKRWRRLGPRVYAPREATHDALLRLKAASLRLPKEAAFSGRTAADLHGLDPQCSAIEATLMSPCATSRLVGITIRRRRLDAAEVVVRHGMRVTSPLRTVVDLASRLELVDGVAMLDAALHRRLIRLEEIELLSGARGVRRLRRAIELAEPASESPIETRLRLILVVAGLPRPRAQVSLHDDAGWFVGRADQCYQEQRLVIEYDGATHRDSLAADNRRQNRLVEAGYRVLRFTAADVLGAAAAVVAMVRQAF
jgi:hypothetical protein